MSSHLTFIVFVKSTQKNRSFWEKICCCVQSNPVPTGQMRWWFEALSVIIVVQLIPSMQQHCRRQTDSDTTVWHQLNDSSAPNKWAPLILPLLHDTSIVGYIIYTIYIHKVYPLNLLSLCRACWLWCQFHGELVGGGIHLQVWIFFFWLLVVISSHLWRYLNASSVAFLHSLTLCGWSEDDTSPFAWTLYARPLWCLSMAQADD